MRALVLHVLGFLAFAACSNKEQALPEGVLDRAKFTAVLVEMQLVEARMNHELVVAPQGQVPVDAYADDVFKEQGVTRESFTTSFTHYAKDPEDLKRIYEEVITELGRRKDLGLGAPKEP